MTKEPKKTSSAPPRIEHHVERLEPPDLFDSPDAYEPPERLPWPEDQDDEFLTPFGSFVNDFVYSMKGKESPVLFNIFGALWTLSTASARKSYFRWDIESLWPNLYVLFVADPSYCHKGAAPGRGTKLLKGLWQLFPDDKLMQREKSFNFMNSNTSSEFMFDMLEPKTEYFIMGDKVHKELFGSQVTIWASELTTMISSKKYASGMIENLTDWFDCADESISGTKNTGKRTLRNIYITMIAATQPELFKNKLPEEAYLSGFMSRCIVIYQQKPSVLWPEPVSFEGAPTVDTMLPKLRWLLYNIRGEYDFTEEARSFYHTWYIEHQTRVMQKESQVAYYARARFTQTVIRIAMLLRMSEYRRGREVDVVHLQHAIKLLEHVFTIQQPLTAEVNQGSQIVPYIRVKELLRKEGQLERTRLLRRMSSRGVLSSEVNAALSQLHQEGSIAFLLNGRERKSSDPTVSGHEVYKWTATTDER